METSQAQKKASQNYRIKQKQRGITQHLIWADSIQWEVIKQVAKAIKRLDFSRLESIEIDDGGKFIKFIYDNRAETRVVLTNQSQDDEV